MIRYNNDEIRNITDSDIKLAKMLIKQAFPNEKYLEELELFGSKVILGNNYEIMLKHKDVYYIVNTYAFYLKGETNRRWIYRIFFSNDENEKGIWRFVHPNTYNSYNDELDFDLTTLPIVE